jgi:hypothetical protein
VPERKQGESHSATNEPWTKPGQTSQDPAHQHPPGKDVVEQEKNKKQDK